MKLKNILLIGCFFICIKNFAQLNTFYVKPHAIDTGYLAAQDSHYVALNKAVNTNNLLLLLFDGSGSNTKDYLLFPNLAANLGYHVVSLAYPNSPTVGSLCDASSDSLCFDQVRQEICYGTPVSTKVSVDTFNCIYTRLTKLLQYLSATYPGDGWGQFISNNNPVWSSIVTSGHSQGAGHALYLAKTQNVHKVAMFSGVDDFSTHFNKAAHWIYGASVTPVNKIYSFLHLQDDVESYPHEYQNILALGMFAGGDDSTLVDTKTSPYSNSHCLYTNITPPHATIPSAYHDATVVDYFTPLNGAQPLYKPVWTYMLTDNSNSAGIQQMPGVKEPFEIYPNPVADAIFINRRADIGVSFKVVNTFGQTILDNNNFEAQVGFLFKANVSNLVPGVYFITDGSNFLKLIKE